MAGCVHATTLWSWTWLTWSTTPSRNCRSGGGRHSVPSGRQEPPSVATASAFDSRVYGACGGGGGPRGFLQETKQVLADALRTCTRNLGVDHACGGKRTGANGDDDLPEAPTTSGSRGGEACQDRRRPFLDPWFRRERQLNEARLIARKFCREKTYRR